MVELAVFGSLFLVVLAALIRFGLATTYRQQLQQDAFRRALAAARGANAGGFSNVRAGSVLIADRMVPSPAAGPFTLSPRSRVAASAQVLWGSDLFGGASPSPSAIAVNGDVRNFTATDFQNGQNRGLQPDVTKDVAVNATLTRRENPSGITTVNDTTQTETITSTIKTGAGDAPVVSTLTRKRTIRIDTPFDK